MDIDGVLSHGRPPMWIWLQDHPATVLKHMALIDRNEAGISIVHVLPYTVADLEGAKPAPARPPLGVGPTSHALQSTENDCHQQLHSAPNSETLLGELTALLLTHGWFKGDPTSKGKGRGGERKGWVGHGSPNTNSWIRPWYRLQV